MNGRLIPYDNRTIPEDAKTFFVSELLRLIDLAYDFGDVHTAAVLCVLVNSLNTSHHTVFELARLANLFDAQARALSQGLRLRKDDG